MSRKQLLYFSITVLGSRELCQTSRNMQSSLNMFLSISLFFNTCMCILVTCADFRYVMEIKLTENLS